MDGHEEVAAAVTQSKKKKIRGGHRAHLTKLLNEIKSKIPNAEAEKDRLLTLKSCVERKASTLSGLDEEILEELDDEAMMVEVIEAAEQLQNQIQSVIIQIKTALKVDEQKPDIKPALREKKKRMNLPKYTVEDYYGDPKKWRTFRDSFNVAVMKDDELSDVEKFHYLRGYLKGEALLAIEGLEVTNENFQEAYQILEKRFGNKQMIVNSHMEEFCAINKVEDKDDTKGLRKVYDKVEMNLRSLRALSVDPNQYGSLLVPILKNRLPEDVVLLLSRKFDSSVELWEVDQMMKELRLEIEARERCYTGKEDSGNSKEQRKKKSMTTTETLLSSSNKNKMSCPYCERPHFPDKCQKVTDPKKRKEILVEKKRCFTCTRSGHNSQACKAKKTCYKCQ